MTTVYKYSAFVLCEGRSTSKFEKTMESLRGLVGAQGLVGVEDLDVACLFDRNHYEIAPEVLQFIRKAEDKTVTAFTNDSNAKTHEYWQSRESQTVYYEMTPEVLQFIRKAEDKTITDFTNVTTFTNASSAHDINQYLQDHESQVFFFLHEGDTVDPYYLLHLESFFRKNSGVCSVAYVPVVSESEDLNPSLSFRKDALDSELVSVKDDESIPLSASYGVALWTQDAQEAGLNPDPGHNGLRHMLDEMLKRLIQPKGVYGLINGVCHVREKALPRKIMGIAEAKEFLVSCIIPIYNVEKYLCEAIDSVINQNIGFEKNVELILINDGSTDASGAICEEYKEKYPGNIAYIEQENAGVSAARNAGLDVASGEFVAFLDGDDRYSENFFEAGVKFLREHGDEMDFVAMPLKLFGNVRDDSHPLNVKFDKGSRVIDTRAEPQHFIMHLHAALYKYSAAEKYRMNPKFAIAEDADWLHRHIQDNPKYGVCVETAYNYRRGHEESIISGQTSNLLWYRKLLDLYPEWIARNIQLFGKVTRYTQSMIMYDLQWFKLEIIPDEVKSKINLDELRNQLSKIVSIIDDDIITDSKSLNHWQKYYLLTLKHGEAELSFQNFRPIFVLNNQKFENFSPTVWVNIVEEYNGSICLSGFFYLANYRCISLVVFYKQCCYESERLLVNFKDEYFLGTTVHKAYVFDLKIPFDGEGYLEFYFYVDGVGYFLCEKFGFAANSRMRNKPRAFVLGDKCILTKTAKQNIWAVSPISLSGIKLSIEDYIKHNPKVFQDIKDIELLREYLQAYPILAGHKIWLFSDRKLKADDNAEHLFRYCANIDDGIEKYFLVDSGSRAFHDLKSVGNVLAYGSMEHKLLSFFAEKWVFSDYVFDLRYPFGSYIQSEKFQGLCKAKFCFLQHGVTKDDMTRHFSRWNVNCKLLVTAGHNEYTSLLDDNYGYNSDIIKLTGFPRFDGLKNSTRNQILFLPTWRNNLAIFDDIYSPRFKETLFFAGLQSFLSNKRLLDTLHKLKYDFVIKWHPRLLVQQKDFELDPSIKTSPVDESYQTLYAESALAITDYSSAVFDFAYLKKPILYYHFCTPNLRPGYFDYESDGFGEVTYAEDEFVDLIVQYMENACEMKEEYKQRVDDFFAFNDKNNCKRVYDAIFDMR
jgi:glycosyltransferase involved in cell wall biosynthesis